MNMQAIFFDPRTDGNPNKPVCGYCNLTEADHEGQNHVFDAVGGSLSAIDWRNGPPPIGVFAAPSARVFVAKCALIAALSVACWYGAIQLARAAGDAIHLLHSYI
jgi:hypothetical protein